MKNYVLRQAALLVAAVLLTTSFWSCSKDEEPVPEPTPPVVSVTGVTLNKTSTSIQVGGTETLTATVSPKDAANKKVTWKSSNAAIASVDANGKVTGVKAGEATITVTTEDGGKTATCKVTVSDKEIKVTGVKLNKSETSLLVGGNETLTATVLPEDATNQNVTWKSDKPEIATVDANGKVTAVKVGEATITVTTEDGGKTATCKVTVSETSVAVTGVTLNKTALTLNIGASETLSATVAPADATNKKVTWKSSDAAVATVDTNGKVTAVKAGEATITVTTEDGGKTATCKVTVPEPEINRFVLFGKTYPAFTVFVSKEVLGKGNYDIYVYPAEDNTIELGLQCSMQHDGMSLDLTKYDPLNAVPGYSGWMWYISVEKTEEGKEEYLLEGWGGDAPTMGILGLAGDILYIKSLNSDHTQFEIRCKFTDPLKGSLDFYYKGAVELFE